VLLALPWAFELLSGELDILAVELLQYPHFKLTPPHLKTHRFPTAPLNPTLS
jgi:hypothetical protein